MKFFMKHKAHFQSFPLKEKASRKFEEEIFNHRFQEIRINFLWGFSSSLIYHFHILYSQNHIHNIERILIYLLWISFTCVGIWKLQLRLEMVLVNFVRQFFFIIRHVCYLEQFWFRAIFGNTINCIQSLYNWTSTFK